MKNALAIGVILILLGGVILAWPVISYTDRDTVVDLGPVEVTSEDTDHIVLPRVLGAAAIAAGVTLAFLGGRRRSI